jgi:hypothetical protein
LSQQALPGWQQSAAKTGSEAVIMAAANAKIANIRFNMDFSFAFDYRVDQSARRWRGNAGRRSREVGEGRIRGAERDS